MTEYSKVIQMIETLEEKIKQSKPNPNNKTMLLTASTIKMAVYFLQQKEMAEMGAYYESKK